MHFDIVTIFPYAFNSYLNESILKRAQKKKLIQIKIYNLRDFTKDKHKKVDDKPYGGGPGMVLKIEPIIKAISSILKISNSPACADASAGRQFPISKKKVKIILFSPVGKQFDNKIAHQLAKNYEHLILICGHYEGVDERIKKAIRDLGFKLEEISVGPYVLTGGELAAIVLIDAVSRQIPGVLGKEESLEEKRFGVGVPVYTRPGVFIFKPPHQMRIGAKGARKNQSSLWCGGKGKKYSVPKVLLSGNHKKIKEWRRAKQHKR